MDSKNLLCYVPVTGRIVSNFLFNFCIWKFSDVNNLDNEWLRNDNYLWHEDDTQNEIMNKGILIKKAHEYSPQDAQQRPALIVKNNATKLGPKISIGNRTHTPTKLHGEANPNTTAMLGDDQQSVGLGGGVTIYAIHKEPAIAEILGEELYYGLLDFMRPIKKALGLDEFTPSDLGELTKITEFKENWAVPINVIFKFRRSTIIKQEAPLLKGISMQLNKH